MTPPLLEARDVVKRFGGVTAVDGMGIRVEKGEIVGLIGPNGAGKTTFFNCLAGFCTPGAGSIIFDGREIAGNPPHKVSQAGLARTFQLARTLARMSVLENTMLAAQHQRGESLWRALALGPIGALHKDEARVRERALEVLAIFGLTHMKDAYAGSLSGGQRKLLELARALMTEPKLMLLDEPMAGVNPSLGRDISRKILELREDHGMTFLIIEHDMETVMTLSDRVTVMAEGSLLAEGTPHEVRTNRAVIDAYLGG